MNNSSRCVTSIRCYNTAQALDLPPEILGDIFLHCISVGWQPSRTEAPLLLLQICSYWRQVALALPQLWTDLTLGTTTECLDQLTVRKLVHMTRLWFSNAGALPLSFSLNHRGANWGEEDEFTTAAITPFANRYQRLNISTVSVLDIFQYLKLPSCGYADELVSLILHISDPFRDVDLESPITVFESAPKLRKVSLSISHEFTHTIRLPWSQLTHLDMIGCSISPWQFHTLLRACTYLVYGAFRTYRGTLNDNLKDTPGYTTSDNLSSLTIVFDDIGLCSRLFRRLELPALTLLRVDSNVTMQFEEDISFLHATFRNLRTFSLKAPCIMPGPILSLLHAVPSLVSLKLDVDFDRDVFSSFMDFFTHRENQAPQCLPLLEKLDLYAPFQPPITLIETTFVDMVRSRQKDSPASAIPYLSIVLRIYSNKYNGGREELLRAINDVRMKQEADFTVVFVDRKDDITYEEW